MKQKNSNHRLSCALILPATIAALSGCGGSGNGSGNPAPVQKYMVGGSVSGLAAGASVVLLDNTSDALTISANGAFSFSTALASGSRYAITVSAQPHGQTCNVGSGAGTIGAANVTDIVVNCTNDTYTIGGTIQGLGASGLTLANDGKTLRVSANATSFILPTTATNGSAYDVTVQANPAALNCAVVNGAGTVNGANVTSISVSCAPGTESVLYSFVGGATDGANPDGTLIQASDGNFYGLTQFGGAVNEGTVFELTPGGAETVLHSFQGGNTDGAYPYRDLVQAIDGNLYGMTANGGASGYGTIFKVTPDGAETVLYSFKGGTADGAYPQGNLIQASNGNFYGMTSKGGAYDASVGGDGVVFEITPGGTETVLYSFQGGDGDNPTGSLLQASDGNFYGMTPYGGWNSGGSNNGVVFKITPDGAYSVLYPFQSGTTDGISPNGSLIQASDGNFYGMTSQGGGAPDGGVVFKVTAGGAETVLYSFQGGLYSTQVGTTDGGNPSGSLIQASDGNLYGMTRYGGAKYDGVIFRITPGGVEAILYSFQGTTTDGANPSGNLIQASDGNLYGMTYSGGAGNLGTVFKLN